MKMDARRQRRLGPAPIASFEKSFEDNNAGATAVPVQIQTHAQAPAQQQAATSLTSSRNISGSHMMESHGNSDDRDSNSLRRKQPVNDDVAISGSGSNTAAPAGIGIGTGTDTDIDIDITMSGKYKNDGGTTRRAPPLKTTATAATVIATSNNNNNSNSIYNNNSNSTLLSATSLTTPSTPRIELSRASSSSHHEDSRESSPENVFEQVGTGTLQETIGLGFREEGALELRSSTEELYFMDVEQKREERDKFLQQQQQQQHQHQQQQQHPQQQQQQATRSSPHIFKFDDQQTYLQQHQRKDSASSEVAALLCISGRTSRISSVGSQGSAVSRLSAVSGISRSPSPHRMLLETSFCGPKPLENVVDSSVTSSVEPAAAELLEQVILARKHDPTQAVLAEGIHMEMAYQTQDSSKKKKPPTSLSNGDSKVLAGTAGVIKSHSLRSNNLTVGTSGSSSSRSTVITDKIAKPILMGQQRRSTKSPGQMVVGKTPDGTEYIRINLKPDHLYGDKGIASNERLVEAPNTLNSVYGRGQKKPVSLSIGGQTAQAMDETRLTPTASPKPSHRQNALAKDARGSRSPSPAALSVSRKSSFSSLFRFGGGTGKDSPDSPRDHRSRSRSKSKERQTATPQSQNVTPSKQKSVLGLFKPGKRGSTSKSSSPVDSHEMVAVTGTRREKCQTPLSNSGSRPASRLRYYDEPVEGYIHIPLHTPPDEKETRQLLQGIQQLNAEPVRPAAVAITANQLAAAAAALKPVVGSGGTTRSSTSDRSSCITTADHPKVDHSKVDHTKITDSGGTTRPSIAGARMTGPPIGGVALPCSRQIEKLQRVENLDIIQSLPTCDPDDIIKERTWSLEVSCHTGSLDSQETEASEGSCISAIKMNSRSHLANVQEQISQENDAGGEEMAATAEIHSFPQMEAPDIATIRTGYSIQTPNTVEELASREKRRLLFATRLGSGSQEQVFTTQFSISKTESLSSQLSDQIGESSGSEFLHRQDTVIRRIDDAGDANQQISVTGSRSPSVKREIIDTTKRMTLRQKSQSTSEDEPMMVVQTAAVVMRCKEPSDDTRRKSRSTSEEDADTGGSGSGGSSNRMTTQRHSRYLENFDVRRNYRENIAAVSGTRSKTSKRSNKETMDFATFPSDRWEESSSIHTKDIEITQLPQLPAISSFSAMPSTPTVPPTVPTKSSRSHSGSRSGTPTKPPRSTTAITTPTRSGQSTIITTPPSNLAHRPPITAIVTPARDRTTSAGRSSKRSVAAAKERQSVHSTDEPIETSESERESENRTSSGRPATSVIKTDVGHTDSQRIDRRPVLPRHICGLIEDHESTGLVSQESFDDELPYVPTTLPEERAQGVALIPIKERANMELKTFPVDRPRSTTPLNPSHLEEYCGIVATPDESVGLGGISGSLGVGHDLMVGISTPIRGEKLRISLPRKDSATSRDKTGQSSTKSPRRISNAGGRSWFEFAEEGMRGAGSNLERKDSNKQLLVSTATISTSEDTKAITTTTTMTSMTTTMIMMTTTAGGGTTTAKKKTASTITSSATSTVQATQITPTATTTTGSRLGTSGSNSTANTSTQRKLSGHWIDFENIPEKRKPPKRITTLPRDGHSSAIVMSSSDSHYGRQRNHIAGGQHSAQPDVTVVVNIDNMATTTTTTSASVMAGGGNGKLHYNYVEPEDCQCECHEMKRSDLVSGVGSRAVGADCMGSSAGLVADGGGASGSLTSTSNTGSNKIVAVDLLQQQGEDMLPLLDPEIHDSLEPSDSSRDFSCYTDDEVDPPARASGSRRMRSNKLKLDEFPRRGPSPRNKKFPDQ